MTTRVEDCPSSSLRVSMAARETFPIPLLLSMLKLGCATSINIWIDSVTYDEFTINERQKSDAEFADILDCVRRGCPTDKTNATLQQRVIQGSITDKFEELCQVGQAPLYLFPTRYLCKQYNKEMLDKLGYELHELVCVDEDGRGQPNLVHQKMVKQAAKQLKKLKMTAI